MKKFLNTCVPFIAMTLAYGSGFFSEYIWVSLSLFTLGLVGLELWLGKKK